MSFTRPLAPAKLSTVVWSDAITEDHLSDLYGVLTNAPVTTIDVLMRTTDGTQPDVLLRNVTITPADIAASLKEMVQSSKLTISCHLSEEGMGDPVYTISMD